MMQIALYAALTAFVCLLLLKPLAARSRRAALLALTAIPLCAAGLYLALGAPDIPAAPALFDKDGPAAQQRAALRHEFALMRALAEKPDDTAIMLELGRAQLRGGRIESAIGMLERAQRQEPENHAVRQELGAAYYASGLALYMMDETAGANARALLEKARATAPDDAPYRAKLDKDIARLR